MNQAFNTITSEDWRREAFVNPAPNNMKTLIALLLVGVSRITAAEDLRFLNAIAQVESGTADHPYGDDSAIGRCGARGRYQISEVAWRMHTNEPHSKAHRQLISTAVAVKHLTWLRKVATERNGEEPTYFKLAWYWKCGINYSVDKESNRQLVERVEYANRVLAIMGVSK